MHVWEWFWLNPRNKWKSIDKHSRPYIRLLRESIGGPMYNTYFEHRRGCACTRCDAARARYEAIGSIMESLIFEDVMITGRDINGPSPLYDRLDALAELLKKRYSN